MTLDYLNFHNDRINTIMADSDPCVIKGGFYSLAFQHCKRRVGSLGDKVTRAKYVNVDTNFKATSKGFMMMS